MWAYHEQIQSLKQNFLTLKPESIVVGKDAVASNLMSLQGAFNLQGSEASSASPGSDTAILKNKSADSAELEATERIQALEAETDEIGQQLRSMQSKYEAAKFTIVELEKKMAEMESELQETRNHLKAFESKAR